MPYELGTIWNVTSKYIYNTLDKNIGIGTTTPICELDVYGDISEKGISLKEKYELKPENNKKYDLIVREDLDTYDSQLIIWYKFNKENFNSNYASLQGKTLKGNPSIFQSEYYVGTGSAEINDELYYKIEMNGGEFQLQRYTFCFWLFLNEECISDKFILNLQDTSTGSTSSIDLFNFTYVTNKLKINKNSTVIEYNCILDIKKWHHISIIIDDTNTSNKIILLVNGIEINTSSATSYFLLSRTSGQNSDQGGNQGLDGAVDIYLGYTNNSINGYIDDFRIYATNLSIDDIRTNIIGKITKITPGNISANGNYGIDIVNYSNLINIGGQGQNSNVNLTIYGDLRVTGELNIPQLTITNAEYETLTITSNLTVSSNVNIHNDLTVNKTITENQRTLAQKYASISQINKHTDLIISKMTDREDVRDLYSNMPEFFQSNLILAYDFDFNVDNIDNPVDFFSNNVLQLNTDTDLIYSTFSGYNIEPNINNKAYPIDYYGTKYVKGNSSLYCGSNIFNSGGIDYYSFKTQTTNTAYFSSSKNYTIAFWIRFNEIDKNQYIFNFGVPVNNGDIENSINLSLNTSNNLNINVVNEARLNNTISNNINQFEFKKDEWYHIVLILKNDINITSIPTDIEDSNLLIQYFSNLGYNDTTYSGDPYFTFEPQTGKSTIFTYVNGIILNIYDYDPHTIFGNPAEFINYFGVLDSTNTTEYLNGYIDDFKMYQTVVPINYINENIIGDALIIKPGLLSAIGNYGINIKNFVNKVYVGDEDNNNIVDLHIYGLLKIEETKLTISNCDIDAIGDTLTTSNFEILETLTASNINVSNIKIDDLISGPGFILGSSSNLIDNIEIIMLSNTNLNSCNITADTITVTDELILANATLSNINIVGINIDDTFTISNSDITIRSSLIIGDNSCNAYRYDFESLGQNRRTNIKNEDDPYHLYSNFHLYYERYFESFPTIPDTDPDTENTQVFDKSIIFYGNTDNDSCDICFKNNYIRDEYCNIKDEINKSYGDDGDDRNRTRIKLDVGNIKLQNGFIELKHFDILEGSEPSKLKIEENKISITSNANTTILNDSLMLSNTNNHCVLTNSNFMFNNRYGFINNETLSIKTIQIDEEIEIIKIITTNNEDNDFSIDTLSNTYLGKIRGFLSSNSKIDIDGEIKTNSNITGSNIIGSNITADDITIDYTLNVSNINTSNITITDTLNTSNIICDYEITFKEDSTNLCNTKIKKDSIDVNNLHIYGGITLGQQTGSTNNNINGGFGSLSINTINTTNNRDNDFSIDTLSNTYLGKIRGCLSSNSEIAIDGEIKTTSNITGSNITGSNITTCNITINHTLNVSNIQGIDGICSIEGRLRNNSEIYINCNITTTQTIQSENQYTSNTLYASNIRGIDGTCSIEGILEGDSEINISGDITTSGTLYTSNIQGIDGHLCSIEGRLCDNSEIDIYCNIITTKDIRSENQYTSNTLYTSNIQGIDVLCSIIGRLRDNSEIDISGDITTSGTLYASNALYVANIQGINEERCSIIGRLENDSIININGNITTSSNITGNNLYIDNIYSTQDTTEIIFYSDTCNNNVTSCKVLNVAEINSFDSINKIKIYNDIIIENKTFGDRDPYVILSTSNITINDENKEFKFETNKISYNVNGNKKNIIDIDSASSNVVITCDNLKVTRIDFDSDQFEFDKIITYTRNPSDGIEWPNVYIGSTTQTRSRQEDRFANAYLDVLYVDTPGDSRLKTGNILIQNTLTINDQDVSDMNFKIITKEAFTFFKNHHNADLLVFSLQNKSIGINTKPPDSDYIKLFVKDGGIQTTGDIIAFANISDKRFKMNITSFNTNDGIDIINKLNPVRFTWKNNLFNAKMANKDDIGFIAQEVAEIIPEAVAKCRIEMNDIDYNYINYERIIPYLVNNIKYLNNKIVELEDKLNGIR